VEGWLLEEMREGSVLIGFLPDWWRWRAEVVFCAGLACGNVDEE
jgi:hypothetical protein